VVAKIGAITLAAVAIGCTSPTESHNSSQSGATARAGIAEPGNQPTVTLMGCLQNADKPQSATAGTSGSTRQGSAGGAVDQMAAGRGSPGERFTLTDARSASAASNPAAGSYVLDGNLEALRAHVNRQVRLTGKLDAAASNSAGPQRVRVESVEPAGGDCGARN
jgi:hypothetical protein